MTELNASMPPLPERFKKLPISDKGFPVPWFVEWVDGKPDFRAIGGGKITEAYKHRKCWLCGEPLGAYMAFTIGPMCAVNRTTSEPGSHRECAEFAARACPFLSNPRMRRNTKDLPEGILQPAGEHLDRNPGACCIYITKSYSPFKANGGFLFELGEPLSMTWFAEGREATKAEIVASIDGGLPALREIAAREGQEAIVALNIQLEMIKPWLPADPDAPADDAEGMQAKVLTPEQRGIAISLDKAIIAALEAAQENMGDDADAMQFVLNTLVAHSVNLVRLAFGTDEGVRGYLNTLIDFRLGRPSAVSMAGEIDMEGLRKLLDAEQKDEHV